MSLSFQVHQSDKRARAATVTTPHGSFDTPAFMPVGTNATVKSLTPEEVAETGSQILLCNAYHLYMRPGQDIVAKMGGLHSFMNWNGPILTDSGGFQVYSLASLRKIDNDGVSFRSHIDGSEHRFTPESVMKLENDLGADIIMCFDECTPYPATREYAENSIQITSNWARRCVESHQRGDQALFGIVQGGVYQDLRERSANDLLQLPFPGYAIGGLMLGEDKEKTWAICDAMNEILPKDKPRYLMGVGTPEDFLEAIYRGVDMFDCVVPTRLARTSHLLTWNGKLTLKQARFREDENPIDENCGCYCCRNYSRAYLRHLFQAGEILASRLASLHNITFFQQFMAKCRKTICEGTFEAFRDNFLQKNT